MRLRNADHKVFKALAKGGLTAKELEAETELSHRAIAEALERLTKLGAVERFNDYTMGPRRVKWRRLVDDEGLRWIIVRRIIDPLLEEHGEKAVDAILDAVDQAGLMDCLIEKLKGRVRRGAKR